MKKENIKENTMGVFHYLTYQRIKESDANLSFFDFIQKLEKLQKTHTIKSSVCNVKNKSVTSYSILLQKKAV
ncbi:hypothetical protein KVL02_00960 [Helicobacter pylori]|uniref:hypothetical protein n=1 Tax=Helicobacter pylori TaxID=210 RepID=UPI000E24DE00|nr:hypothetical protein [Helicobacter pylori]RDY78650.1 hypothetical protein DDP36_01395 [Helicobacter pylori]RDY82116.1 hypothetical protein DDP45_01385 [Helicobacter pylori]RDY82257.1 hypothetical protein DDP35_01165 [Helicobacter pylori]WQX56598.1 hypothetical protein KVL02_00960 [Helicobacter pylori]